MRGVATYRSWRAAALCGADRRRPYLRSGSGSGEKQLGLAGGGGYEWEGAETREREGLFCGDAEAHAYLRLAPSHRTPHCSESEWRNPDGNELSFVIASPFRNGQTIPSVRS